MTKEKIEVKTPSSKVTKPKSVKPFFRLESHKRRVNEKIRSPQKRAHEDDNESTQSYDSKKNLISEGTKLEKVVKGKEKDTTDW